MLQCGSLAVRHRVALCALGAKAVHHKGVRLVQVRAALATSVGRDSSESWARRRCIAAALLCTDVRLAMLKRTLSGAGRWGGVGAARWRAMLAFTPPPIIDEAQIDELFRSAAEGS
ncbi:hypothetical protein BZM27_42125 [Paraburkholderia steynii]|uniref:Uncharacterized protein n=1 Tax=Paraburkholderia steynii TaxID=1245441 RepID=A0A4R0X2I1_9BURK|nr:hypothetical protein BZM27_42125 [Paraburkholderia steynii]